ncbi:hypothetical protein LOAG_12230 [Loa loa]|uniref:Uncharacterized protein n=1 Tax=Loa loa TaxID=7209 RepID=A0A1S0TLP8_LOALO|nr:hypothetical protein LOAG_12230 [Loa loa]EFO16277.2 hypothetical protein LOAG_12230 [Loa loa]
MVSVVQDNTQESKFMNHARKVDGHLATISLDKTVEKIPPCNTIKSNINRSAGMCLLMERLLNEAGLNRVENQSSGILLGWESGGSGSRKLGSH